MGTIRTAIALYDGVTSPLTSMNRAMNVVLNSFESMQQASGKAVDVASIQQARGELALAQVAFDGIEKNINNAATAQKKLNNDFRNSGYELDAIKRKVLGIGIAVAGVVGIGKLTSYLDGAFARIDTMNQFSRTIGTITGNVAAAKEALGGLRDITKGTAYGLNIAAQAAQGFVTRGASLGAATNQVRVWADAVSFYGKGTNEELQTVMDAVQKMYTKGKVEMEQLNRLFDVGINPVQIYAEAVGMSAAKVQDDLSSGTLAAVDFINTVTKAMDDGLSAGAAKEMGATTWAAVFANVGAAITRGWVSTIEKIDAALSARGLPSTMEMIVRLGTSIEAAMVRAGNVIAPVFAFFAEYGSILLPIIGGLVTAMIAYGIALQATKTAQLGFNAAVAANPIFRVVMVMIGLVTVLQWAVAWVNKFAGTSYDAMGLIVGAVASAAAFIGNTVIGLLNGLIQFIWTRFVEPFIGIIEWILNVADGGFNSFGGAVANLIGQIISWFLSLGKVVTKIIDAIFGTDWTAGLSSLQDSVLKWGKNDKAVTLSREAPTITSILGIDADRFNYGKVWDKAYAFGAGIGKNNGNGGNLPADNLYGMGETLEGIYGNTSDIKDTIKMSEDELRYLREIAEREAINKFTTAEITVNMTNHNNLASNMDIDGLINEFEAGLEGAIAQAAEGVHT